MNNLWYYFAFLIFLVLLYLLILRHVSNVEISATDVQVYLQTLDVEARLSLMEEFQTPRVIVMVFGGRRDRLWLLNAHLFYLMKMGLVSEYHLWDYTTDANDTKYLMQTSSRFDVSLIQREGKAYPRGNWQHSWKHYYRRLNPGDILLKIDDDIVHIDVESFPLFLQTRRENHDPVHLVPNVVNHVDSIEFQQAAGIFPNHYLPADVHDALYDSPELGLDVHTRFLADVDAFNLEKGREKLKGRVSINFVALQGENFDKFVEIWHEPKVTCDLMNWELGDDELMMSTKVHRHFNAFSQLDFSMTVSHLTYRPQEENAKILLPLYEALLRSQSWVSELFLIPPEDIQCWSDSYAKHIQLPQKRLEQMLEFLPPCP